MGGGASSSADRKDRYHKAVSNPERILKFTSKFNIADNELQKFFIIFESVDQDNSGEINIGEFLKKFELAWDGLGRHIFDAMDISGDSTIEFPELFVGLWNYCTLDHENLKKFAFDLFDFDGSGTIDMMEFKQLLAIIHGNQNVDAKAEKLMEVLDDDQTKHITYEEFNRNVQKLPSLLFEAFSLQSKLRVKCGGHSYWKGATKRRKQYMPEGGDLLDLYHRLYNAGHSLSRAQAKKNFRKGLRHGIVAYDSMTAKSTVQIYNEPKTLSSKRAGKLHAKTDVDIIRELEMGGQLWYQLKSDGSTELWIQAKYVSIPDASTKAAVLIQRSFRRKKTQVATRINKQTS